MKLPLFILIGTQALLTPAEHHCDSIAYSIPACARDCMDSTALQLLGCKSIEDYDCLCNHSGKDLQRVIQTCVVDKCGLETAVTLPSKANELCDCVLRDDKDEL